MTLPAPVLTEHGGFLVVRDDLLPGGTKRRAVAAVIERGREHVYAGPAQGYAQVALAYGCEDAGETPCTLFVAQRGDDTPLMSEARAHGARYELVVGGVQPIVNAKARAYARFHGARLVPLGFDTDAFRAALVNVARALPVTPAEVWCVAGTGTLARCLAEAWPAATVNAVCVGMAARLAPSIVSHRAPESFADDAQEPPPFPSVTNYDAKAWRFVVRHAKPGALVWNVGR